MLGRFQREILTAQHLIKGMSTSSHISDGGFSPTSEGLALQVNPGLLHFPAALTDGDSDNVLNAATDTILASAPDDVTFNGNPRRVVNGVGEYILYDGTKLGAVLRTDSANNDQYNRGFVYMVNFGGETFVTNRKNLVRWKEATPTFNVTFLDFSGVAALSGLADIVPHPLLVYENNLYTASHNELFRTSAVGTAPTVILTLSADQVITELGIDPSTGKMLIATSTAMDASLSVPALNKLLWYNGFSNKVDKSIVVEDTIIGIHKHENTVFIGYGLNLGYLSGGGIQFLRKLAVTRSNATLPYRCSFASIGNILCVIERDKVIAFGEIVRGIKTLYYIHGVASLTKDIDHIFDAGSGKLGLSYANEAGSDATFSILDTTSVSTVDDSVFDTNWERFSRGIYPTEVLIETNGAINTSNISLVYGDQTDSAVNSNSLAVRFSSASTREIIFEGFKTTTPATALRFRFGEASGNNVGIRRAILYYNPFN